VFSSARALQHGAAMSVDVSAFNELTHSILSSAIEVHRQLGPGLLESIYMPCLAYELAERKLRFALHHPVPIVYKGKQISGSYFIDLCVEDSVIVEVKCVASLLPVHEAQTLTYMRLLGCPVGLLINFNVPRLMEGVKRLLNPRARGN
jgi:GxxExxY protein